MQPNFNYYGCAPNASRLVTVLLTFGLVFLGVISTCRAGEYVKLKFPDEAAVLVALRPLASLKKDQYEKTANFTNRVCAETYKALGVDGKTAVTLGLKHGKYETNAEYDADEETFRIRIGTEVLYAVNRDAAYEDQWRWAPHIDRHEFDAINIASTYKELPQSATSNAVKVGFQELAVLFYPGRVYDSKVLYEMKPEEAKRLPTEDLRVAIVTRIQPPCIVTASGHTRPSAIYLYDMTYFEMGFVGSPDSEWIIYRASTKEVLKRGKFD